MREAKVVLCWDSRSGEYYSGMTRERPLVFLGGADATFEEVHVYDDLPLGESLCGCAAGIARWWSHELVITECLGCGAQRCITDDSLGWPFGADRP